MYRITMYSFVVLFLVASLQADRLMEPEETEALVKHLTDNPQKSWISQGMIQARHLEYYDYDNSLKQATETIYQHNGRFRLEVNLDDGLSTDDPTENSTAMQFQQDFKLNQNRTFLWDGFKYVQYYESADYAVVATDSQASPAETAGGPMTAGIIPWGHGDFTFLIIMSRNPISYEFSQDGHNKIRLEYFNETISPTVQVSYTLDPSKDYAVSAYSIENEPAMLKQAYGDYIQVESKWVPTKILVERFDKRSGTPKLLSYEDWQFETVDASIPLESFFSVQFKNGTTVELRPTGNMHSFLYTASDRIDIAKILEEKIAVLETPDPDMRNCATAVVQHLARQFSKDILETQLAALVSAETKKTNLYSMKQTLENAGLNCMAIETDMETLERIPNCTKVLHLALSNHYVIVDHIDPDGIWVIDLVNRKFYVKRELGEFLQDWSHGTALLVSNNAITPPLDANFRYLQTDEMARIQGGDFGTYSCTDQLQTSEEVMCSEPMGGYLCGGAYYSFWERYGCIEDPNGGTCTGRPMLNYQFTYCINHPYWPGACTVTSTLRSRYIRACQ